MSGSLDGHKFESPHRPDHSSNLVLMLMQSRNPPFPPRLFHGNPVLLSEPLQPGNGSRNGYIGIDISGINPDSKIVLNEFGVDPDTGVVEGVEFIEDLVIAHLELDRAFNVQSFEITVLIEKVHDADVIVAVKLVAHKLFPATLFQFPFLFHGLGQVRLGIVNDRA